MTVLEEIPEPWQAGADAAARWYGEREGRVFAVTGIVDPAESPASEGASEFHLVLCSGEICEQKSFRVTAADEGFEIALVEDTAADAERAADARLDPPAGARREWLDRALGQHAFVLLLFYRGFW